MDILEYVTDASNGYFYGPSAAVPQLYAANDLTWFYNLVNYNRGGINGNYTTRWGFPGACINVDADYGVRHQNFQFKNVILFTDGLCGSACSQFSSSVRALGKAAIVSLGGIQGQPMETSSFTGGNVEDWTSIIPFFNQNAVGANAGFLNFFQLLPTTAFTRYNHREMYIGNAQVPREFQRIEPDIKLNVWFPTNNAESIALLATVASQFKNPVIQVTASLTVNPVTNPNTLPAPIKNGVSTLLPEMMAVLLFVILVV